MDSRDPARSDLERVQRGALVVVQVVASSRKHLVECNELDYLPLAASTGGSILANGEVLPRRNVQQHTTLPRPNCRPCSPR